MSAGDMRAFAGGNVIVIGTTAQALGDFVVTPNGRYPGVFTNLRLMDQLMRSTYIRRVPPAVDLALIVLLPLLVGFLVTQLRPIVGIALGAGVVVLYSIFAVLAYALTLQWINLVHVDASIALAALFVALYRTVTEGADKRVITEMFGKHVSPAIVEHMLAHDDPLKALDLSGKRVRVTIFYSDIRGFTAMSEKMSPEEIYGALNQYFEEMCQIVFRYGGFVDKFIGDCLMAVFSAPNPHPNDAYNAVRSAWEQQQKILTMMTEWAAQGRPIFTVGMGLNTGEVVMGNLGSAERLNYTVIGDNVNTAARLYNVAKGGQTIISESTYEEVKDRFIVNELTPVFVKGKTLPLRNFEVIGLLEHGQRNTSTLLDPENLPQAIVAADH
jgi:adenylate cyclase